MTIHFEVWAIWMMVYVAGQTVLLCPDSDTSIDSVYVK